MAYTSYPADLIKAMQSAEVPVDINNVGYRTYVDSKAIPVNDEDGNFVGYRLEKNPNAAFGNGSGMFGGFGPAFYQADQLQKDENGNLVYRQQLDTPQIYDKSTGLAIDTNYSVDQGGNLFKNYKLGWDPTTNQLKTDVSYNQWQGGGGFGDFLKSAAIGAALLYGGGALADALGAGAATTTADALAAGSAIDTSAGATIGAANDLSMASDYAAADFGQAAASAAPSTTAAALIPAAAPASTADALAADNIDVGGGFNPATGTGDLATAEAAAATGVTSSASLATSADALKSGFSLSNLSTGSKLLDSALGQLGGTVLGKAVSGNSSSGTPQVASATPTAPSSAPSFANSFNQLDVAASDVAQRLMRGRTSTILTGGQGEDESQLSTSQILLGK